MNKAHIAPHPSAGLGQARQATRADDFEEMIAAARNLAPEGSAANVALNEAGKMTVELTREEMIKRAANALIRAYLPMSWDRVIAEALRLEHSSKRPEFAQAVRREVETRRNDQELE